MRWWHGLVFAAALIAFAVAIAPMSAFAPKKPGVFTYESVDGPLWSARFADVSIGPFKAQRADWRLSPLDLIRGRVIGDLDFAGGDLEGGLRLLANGRGDRRIVAREFTLVGAPFGAARLKDGSTRVLDADLMFQKGQCTRATGKFETDIFARHRAMLGGFGPNLYGEARCNGAVAEIPLQGREGDAGLAILITLKPDGRATFAATLDGASPNTQAAYAIAGFRPNATQTAMTLDGELTWFPF